MTRLSVNLNKVAVIRNARGGQRPSVLDAARIVVDAGAAGLTVHPRPDQRHITARDVFDIAALIRDEFPHIEFNIEGNPAAPANDGGYPGFDHFIERIRPTQATLVPDADDQLTSDHGWDLTAYNEPLARRIASYQALGVRVSLFLDPDLAQIEAARAHGSDRIELYTGPYAEAVWSHGTDDSRTQEILECYLSAARHAAGLGLGVNAGHDLDLTNLSTICSNGDIDEVSIGHALISDALKYGLFETTRKYLTLLPSD